MYVEATVTQMKSPPAQVLSLSLWTVPSQPLSRWSCKSMISFIRSMMYVQMSSAIPFTSLMLTDKETDANVAQISCSSQLVSNTLTKLGSLGDACLQSVLSLAFHATFIQSINDNDHWFDKGNLVQRFNNEPFKLLLQ